jgi:glycosyltransferase involved in cell wall biosynthesis
VKYIRKVLDSVVNQDCLDEMELLIADGMSTDGTRDILNEYIQKFSHIQLVDNPQGIVPTGMNLALRRSKGDIIIRLDGHTIISSDYVRLCVETLARTGADNVGGCMNAVGTTAFSKAISAATSSPFGVGGGRFHYSTKEEWVDTVYLGAWPRSVFIKIGLFDEELIRDQDDEFNYRILDNGGKIFLNPKIHSDYFVRNTPSALFKQYFQYGLYKVRVLQKHSRQIRTRQFVPPLFVLSITGGFLLSLIVYWGWILLVAIISVYLVGLIISSILIAFQKGWELFFFLPVCFLILHISYGIGFISGLIRFIARWQDKKGKTPSLISLGDGNG